MLKRFYKSLRTQIERNRSSDYRAHSKLVTYFQEGNDFLNIYRDTPNRYTIWFSSGTSSYNNWKHEGVPLREVVLAIKSFDGMTDMFGHLFHDPIAGIFEY